MYSIIANGNDISEGVNTYLADFVAELNKIRTRPGSKAYVIEDGKTYILTNSGEWKEFYSALKKYVDDKLAGIDTETINELKELLEKIESGQIEQLIAVEVTKQISSPEVQLEFIKAVKADPDIVTKQHLDITLEDYIQREELEQSIFNGGNASLI